MDEFQRALYEHVVTSYYNVPHAERKNHHWVMDGKWIQDLVTLDGSDPDLMGSETIRLMGLPVRFVKGSGPPHLEANDD